MQEWLKQNQIPNEEMMNATSTIQQDENDGDVSAEYSSDGGESTTSEEITDSVATCLQGIDPNLTSNEGLENISPAHKVAMRSKSTNRRNSDRPWSVSCVSQLTRNSRQSLTDEKVLESTALSNFSISESALNNLPNKSENSSTRVNTNNNNSSSKNSSLRRRRVKLRKKSLSSNKRSDSGSSIKDNQVSALLKSITKPDAFLLKDLTDAISMMNLVKGDHLQGAQKLNSDEEEDDNQTMKKPEFKIGSITNVYGNPMNLGSLAALANYNSAENRRENNNETGTENLSSFSEHNMWDNYMGEKYNSEAYSEDRDVDAARKLLDCDDYRNFIDSQSDCCSSLNSAANQQMDSLSPPRHRKNMNSISSQPQSSNENSLKQRRAQEGDCFYFQLKLYLHNILFYLERKNFLEILLKKANEYESGNLETERSVDESKLIADCKVVLENTRALKLASTNPQLLRPEDYVRIESFLLNVMNRCTSSSSHSCNNSMVESKLCIRDSLFNSENSTGVNIKYRRTSRADSKGIFSYVTFVASYVIFLFIVTFLLSRIGKI